MINVSQSLINMETGDSQKRQRESSPGEIRSEQKERANKTNIREAYGEVKAKHLKRDRHEYVTKTIRMRRKIWHSMDGKQYCCSCNGEEDAKTDGKVSICCN